MHGEMYGSFSSAIYTLLSWWVLFFVLQRLANRYPKNNSWKKDIILTFIQSVLVLILMPVLANFIR